MSACTVTAASHTLRRHGSQPVNHIWDVVSTDAETDSCTHLASWTVITCAQISSLRIVRTQSSQSSRHIDDRCMNLAVFELTVSSTRRRTVVQESMSCFVRTFAPRRIWLGIRVVQALWIDVALSSYASHFADAVTFSPLSETFWLPPVVPRHPDLDEVEVLRWDINWLFMKARYVLCGGRLPHLDDVQVSR
jgi:hypothetical protein